MTTDPAALFRAAAERTVTDPWCVTEAAGDLRPILAGWLEHAAKSHEATVTAAAQIWGTVDHPEAADFIRKMSHTHALATARLLLGDAPGNADQHMQQSAADDALREQYAAAAKRLGHPEWDADELAAAISDVRDRRMGQLAAGRQTWKKKAEEIEQDRDRLASQVEQLTERLGEYARRGIQNGERADQAEAERDGAYHERAQLLAWLALTVPAVITPAHDIDEPGWQILYLNPPFGQLSWHISPRDAELFQHVERVAANDPRAQWDGHTTDEKYQRIRGVIDTAAHEQKVQLHIHSDPPTIAAAIRGIRRGGTPPRLR